ncbi:MAG: hypothetical protein JOZ87_21895 [Chloroflexi bacterium]|nr:hypothetical protein [Chloroflexota bacterium]
MAGGHSQDLALRRRGACQSYGSPRMASSAQTAELFDQPGDQHRLAGTLC